MNEIIREVVEAGYQVSIEGKMLNNKGKEIGGYLNNRGYKRFSFRNEKYKSYPVMVHRI